MLFLIVWTVTSVRVKFILRPCCTLTGVKARFGGGGVNISTSSCCTRPFHLPAFLKRFYKKNTEKKTFGTRLSLKYNVTTNINRLLSTDNMPNIVFVHIFTSFSLFCRVLVSHKIQHLITLQVHEPKSHWFHVWEKVA